MYKNILYNTLDNGVKIYFLPDNCLNYDYTIKFNNYGSNLDKYNDIYGFQHLLEHSIFYNYRNLNMTSNASTCPTYMTIEFDIPTNKDFNLKTLLYNWIFKNDDNTEINISRNIPREDIIKYIKELNSEYEYRNLLYLSWEIQTFLLTNGNIHYFGGNNITFSDKIDKIKKKLLSPVKIPPKDISIFIKNSKNNLYKQTRSIFSDIKEFKNNISIQYEGKQFYNKAIQINQGKTNSLVFLHFKKDFFDLEILYIISILYPFFDILHDDITNAYYVYFWFNKINDLYTFYTILKNKDYQDLYLDTINSSISNNIYFLNLDTIPTSINIINETYASFFNKNRSRIINYFKLLSTLLEKKYFYLNLTKQYMFNATTNITKEKYYITTANFFEDYFYSYYTNKFNIYDYIKKNKNVNQFYCKGLCNKSLCDKGLYITKDRHNNICFSKNPNKLNFIVYMQSLMYHFVNFYTETLDECIRNILNDEYKYLYKNDSSHEIILSNKIFNINTEYDFFFSVFKLHNDDNKNTFTTIINLQDFLKHKGICYYIDYNVFNFKNSNICFITTTIDNNLFNKLYNNIIHFLKSNNYKINYDIVLSYKSLIKDLSSLNKTIKCIF